MTGRLQFTQRSLFALGALALVYALLSCASPSSPGPRDTVTAPPRQLHVNVKESADGFADLAQQMVPAKFEGINVNFDPVNGSSTDFRLDLQLTWRNVTETEFEAIWRRTTLYLLTLYPSTCGHRAYMLTATLTDPHGHSRTFEEFDTTVAWLWLLHGAKCGETPAREELESVSEHLLDTIFKRMRDDGVFAEMDLAGPEAYAPLVSLRINRADDIAEQVLRVDRNFSRWTMEAEGASVPDYRIDLLFDVQSGSFSPSKAYLGIMTGGLVSPCRSSTITLCATVTGPGAAMTKSYLFSESLSGHMATRTACEVVNETTRPEAFAKLLRKAFRQFERDELVGLGTASPPEATQPPLVLITTARAKAIVRQETLRAAPFARYYFHPCAEYAPDYTLTFGFEFKGGDRKTLSTSGAAAAGAALAFGVNLFCNPTDMVLNAVLRDRQGVEIDRFHIEQAFSFSGVLGPHDCRDDETTNPAAVRELVRKFYAAMEADGTLAKLSTRGFPGDLERKQPHP